jgi:hypothetical protein
VTTDDGQINGPASEAAPTLNDHRSTSP